MLSSDDAVLAVAEGWDGEIPGRTLLQKVAYFLSVLTGSDLGFRPHYYGPYSPLIAATVNERVALGELQETVRNSPRTFEGHDDEKRFYVYQLTARGKRAVEIHRSWNPPEFERAVEIARKIKELGADYMQLAFASKLHLIIRAQKEKPITVEQIRAAAEELDWPLSEEDVRQGATVLGALASAL